MLSIQHTTAVVGIGNSLMGDDGFGSTVIKELKTIPELNADLIDAGTDPGLILDVLLSYQYIIMVDVLDFCQRPGTLCRLSFDDIKKIDFGRILSLHNLNLVAMLKLAERIQKSGANPTNRTPQGYILGIQPEKIKPGIGLSPTVAKALPRVVDLIIQSIPAITPAASGQIIH